MREKIDLGMETYRLDSQLLSDLWTFRAAARVGSITEAGRLLGVTQGAISQRVNRLEARLGTPLFRRKNSRLYLTEGGEAFLEAMNEVAVTLNGVLSRFDRVQRRSLVVSCLPSLATEWLVPHLDGFYAENPELELFVRAELVVTSAERMESEGIDIIIGYQQEFKEDLHSLGKLQEMIIPVCSRAYRQMMDDQDGVPAITRLHDDVPWVGGSRGFEWDAWTAASPSWMDRTIAERHFNLAHLAYHAALCAQGVAVGRAVLVSRLLDRGDLVPATTLPPVPGASYCIMSHRPGNARSPVRKFAAWVAAEMERSQLHTLSIIAANQRIS